MMNLQAVDNAPAADLARLEDHLDAFNAARTGIFDARLLSIVLKDAAGEVYAGVHGHTWGRCCEIKTLWVAETERGRGLGSELLGAAEAEALARGCRQVVLRTHSFQAPDFYARHGYRRLGAVEDYPAGHSEIQLVKPLAG